MPKKGKSFLRNKQWIYDIVSTFCVIFVLAGEAEEPFFNLFGYI